MFYKEKCDLCGDCFARCKYIDFEQDQASKEMEKLIRGEDVIWLNKCITCFACNEYCTKGARPFDLILKRMEEKGDYIDPNLFNLAKEMVSPKGEFQLPDIKGPVMSLCTVYSYIPWAFQGKIFDNLTLVRGRHFFCNVMYPHMGNETLLKQGLKPLVDRFASLGVDEVIFIHDDCYAAMTDIATQYGIKVPFKPVHIFEYLLQYLKDHRYLINPLHMRVAYQRPCASWLTPWKEGYLDEIFSLIGVKRVDRVYDRENALCCGQDMNGLQSRGDKYPMYKDLNIQDALEHRAQAMIFLCPLCLDSLYKKCKASGLETYMISDLCRLAIGETLPEDAYKILQK